MSEPTRDYPQRPFSLPADATEVILVRHGASQAHVPDAPFDLLDGHSNPPLAPEGRAQAERVAQRLAGEPIDRMFVTTLQRTHETAAPLAAALGQEPAVVPGLREVLLGDWEGGELRVRFANGDPLVARIFAEQRWDVIPNAESPADLERRTQDGLREIVAATGPGGTAVAVLHGGVIGELCRFATDARRLALIHADNGSISRLIVFGDGRQLLRSFNDVAHLPG